ncbi:MAG: nuclear transport factor 2 family protein [Deltaproteobacteria bacterium]|nr:nuclear transport factor 2 family protein [Deltaproteobacteria bacterium]
MLSQQEISDRFEIQDLIYRYSQLIDSKEFDTLATDVFTPDAFIDYSAFGGSKGDLATTIRFLKKAMKQFPNTQHMNANIQLKLDGDRATGRLMCYNPQEFTNEAGKIDVFVCGLWYVDEYVRTAQGWRIKNRVEERCYVANPPKIPGL